PINLVFPGGLRGLRPPATFFATLRVAEVSQQQLPSPSLTLGLTLIVAPQLGECSRLLAALRQKTAPPQSRPCCARLRNLSLTNDHFCGAEKWKELFAISLRSFR